MKPRFNRKTRREAFTRPRHGLSAQADIAFSEPRIHSPGEARADA
jgi:hypothetical protein